MPPLRDDDPRVMAGATALAAQRHGWHPEPRPEDIRDAQTVIRALDRMVGGNG
jgi:hypothetical protein